MGRLAPLAKALQRTPAAADVPYAHADVFVGEAAPAQRESAKDKAAREARTEKTISGRIDALECDAAVKAVLKANVAGGRAYLDLPEESRALFRQIIAEKADVTKVLPFKVSDGKRYEMPLEHGQWDAEDGSYRTGKPRGKPATPAVSKPAARTAPEPEPGDAPACAAAGAADALAEAEEDPCAQENPVCTLGDPSGE